MFNAVSFRIRNIILLLLCLASATSLYATHNRAGEISIEQVGDCAESLEVRATIVTYTKASSRPADRDTLEICWGDGTCQSVARSNGPGQPPQGEILENDTKFNIYIAFHTFPARGTYVISMTDPNRNGGILNVNFPNSDQIRFHIQTTYTFPNPQFQGCNNTPVLLQPPIDLGCVGQVFTHNPNAYDADGDSLSYHLIVPYQEAGLEVPNYLFPDQINPGPNNGLSIDEITGDITWDAPQRAGEYNLAMIIVEHRQGIPLDTIVRDMQILIEECDNLPPEIEVDIEEICVVAGEIIDFGVTATAPENNQLVRLTALGGPFEVPISPATFEPDDVAFKPQPNEKTFRWETTCEHISDQYYSVVFKATDNFFGDTFGLATLKTVRIKVVGPPPQDVDAVALPGQVDVSWESPYVCEDAAFEYFRGFTVWRRIGSNTFPPDTCNPGLAGRGYERITPVPVSDIVDGRYHYVDETAEQGRTYCYRILAVFARTTPGGEYTYNVVESLPSDEVCLQLNRDVPLITNVSVESTSDDSGTMEVCWSKPNADDLDTLLNPGPYRYEVLRATGQTDNEADFQPIGVSFTSPDFAGANDTCFVDTDLNTAGTPYSYRINFYAGGGNEPLGATNGASSVFLDANPTDRRILLSWEELVPWDNYEFRVFRRNDAGVFELLGTVEDPEYVDRGLVNGREYCYRIQSVGSYGVGGVINPILNFSQEICAVPVDDVAPCAPELQVSTLCDQINAGCSEDELLFNTLTWISPAEICPEEGDDVAGFNIYFAPVEGADFELVASIDQSGADSYEHSPERGIAGCYAISAFDGLNNESPLSNIVCVDNCPTYNLPNAFTPNGDGQNDLFKPYPFCFIERVEFKVFNRWGEVVFQTTDPNLNWNGTNNNGQELADGVYYYVCRVFEQRVTGTLESPDALSGYIEVIRSANR